MCLVHTSLSSYAFSFLGLHSMRRSRWPSWRPHDQQSQFLVPRVFQHSKFLIWSLEALRCFSGPASFHGDELVQSHVDSQRWTLSKPLLSTLGRSEGDKRFRDKFAVWGGFSLKQFLLSFQAVQFSLRPSISTSPTLRKKKHFVDQDSWVPFQYFNSPPWKPQAFVECVPILARKSWKNDVP